MSQQMTPKRWDRFEYDPTTGRWVVATLVLAAVVLGVLAFGYQGSPRMDDRRQLEKGVTIPNPTELSPAQTTPR